MGIRGLDEQLHEQRESDTSDVGFLHSSRRRKFKRKKGCAGPENGQGVWLEILGSTKLRRVLMGFDRERLFFISCPVSQIIFQTRARSSTERDELLLSTLSIRTVRNSRHSAPLGKKPQIVSALNLLISLGQD